MDYCTLRSRPTEIGSKGLAAWIAGNHKGTVVIRHRGKVVLEATHLDSKDIPRIAEAFCHKA